MDYSEKQLAAVNEIIEANPYPDYKHLPVGSTDEAARARRYARTIALLLLTKKTPSEDSR